MFETFRRASSATRSPFRMDPGNISDSWADSVTSASGYSVGDEPIGAADPEVGPPTQMAIFTR